MQKVVPEIKNAFKEILDEKCSLEVKSSLLAQGHLLLV